MKKIFLLKKNSNPLPDEPTKEVHVPGKDFSVEMRAMTQRLTIRVWGILVITDIILYIALRLSGY
ncbi:MAG: hypothetical protein ACLGG0_10375 [Bacteriovoracia bacterium]